jgi:hypothetical protein
MGTQDEAGFFLKKLSEAYLRTGLAWLLKAKLLLRFK